MCVCLIIQFYVYVFLCLNIIYLLEHHLRNFFIEVLRSFNETSPAICHYQTQAVNASGVFHCHPAIKGEYVRIRKLGPVPKEEVLALCEVEVYGYYDGNTFCVILLMINICAIFCLLIFYTRTPS